MLSARPQLCLITLFIAIVAPTTTANQLHNRNGNAQLHICSQFLGLCCANCVSDVVSMRPAHPFSSGSLYCPELVARPRNPTREGDARAREDTRVAPSSSPIMMRLRLWFFLFALCPGRSPTAEFREGTCPLCAFLFILNWICGRTTHEIVWLRKAGSGRPSNLGQPVFGVSLLFGHESLSCSHCPRSSRVFGNCERRSGHMQSDQLLACWSR